MTTDIPNTEIVGYEGLADTYQMTKQALWREVFENSTVEFLLREITPGSRVLDLGCGGGFHIRSILERKTSVEAIDLSQDQIALAKKEFADIAQVTFRVADARYYRPSQTFDVVTGFWLLNYAASQNALKDFFETIAASLKPDGLFLGINDNPFNSEQTYPGYQKYGFVKECETPRIEGSRVVWALTEPVKMKITNYWWSPQTYRNAALAAGLELEFLAPHKALSVAANHEFWDVFQDDPPFIAIKARNRKVIQ